MGDPKIDALAAYGSLAELGADPTLQAGRYAFQAEAERRILADIGAKLRIEPHHRLLDIGCGAGALSIPLSFVAAHVVGVDHPDTVRSVGERFKSDRLTLIGGAFPDVPLPDGFDRIIAYSVLICMPDFEAAKAFALAAAGKLLPGGRLLLGDMPNRDRQARFRSSAHGQRADREWAALKANNPADAVQEAVTARLSRARQIGNFSDEEMFELVLVLRKAGFEAYVLPQSPDLPFGNTREDILVVRN